MGREIRARNDEPGRLQLSASLGCRRSEMDRNGKAAHIASETAAEAFEAQTENIKAGPEARHA